MSLTRKMLKAMGIEEEKIDQIIEAHSETVDSLKADRDTYKEDAEKLKTVQKELYDLKAKGDDGWKEKHDKLKGEFDQYKTDVQAKETEAKIKSAYKAILKNDAKLSDAGIEKAVKYADYSKFELEADGETLKDADTHAKAAQEEWAMFVTTTTTTGAKTSNPPANNGNSGVTKEDFQKMSYKDRLQIYNENPDLYNELTT